MSNSQPLKVVDRGSETQLQVGEKLNKITWRDRVNHTNRNNSVMRADIKR